MITPGDEYPLHQASRPVRDPGTNRNFYDRFFFNGYTRDAAVFWAVALGMYPGRNIMDAAFAVSADGVQHNVRASRLLGDDRLETSVGPVRITIVEPLRRLRIDVDDADMRASLEFTARGPILEEPHYVWKPRHLTLFDMTRMTQHGTWSGTISFEGTELSLSDAATWGTRDRSWGIRPVGEREGGAPDGPFAFYWLWAPLNFDDGGALFDVNENPDGSRWHSSAFWFGADGAVDRGAATYSLRHRSGTRHADSATLEFELSGSRRSVQLTPLSTFFMQGIGYSHPAWGHGMFVGPDVRTADAYELATMDEMAPVNQHVQVLCRAERDDGVTGLGVLEQLVIGPHEPSGFREILDPAP